AGRRPTLTGKNEFDAAAGVVAARQRIAVDGAAGDERIRLERGRRGPPRALAGPDPYTVLGVARDADERTVKRAYRKLIGEYHPDRMSGAPEELRRRAEARASEINAAWERIQSERGFK